MLKFKTTGTREALLALTSDMKLADKAIAEGINETAKAVQASARTLVQKTFKLRSPQSSRFLLRSAAVIKPFATPAAPVAVVSIGNADRLLLSSFEEGGTQKPRPGKQARAVPIAARPNPLKRIPGSKLISALRLKKAGAGSKGVDGTFTTHRGIFQRKKGRISMLYAFKAFTPIRRMLPWRATAKATAAGRIQAEALRYLNRRLSARKNRGTP